MAGFWWIVFWIVAGFFAWRAFKADFQKREDEAANKAHAQQRIKEAVEQQRGERELGKVRAQQEQRERVLLASGDIVANDKIEEATVTCGNGHVHCYAAFQYAAGTTVKTTSNTRTTYGTTTASTSGYAYSTDKWGFADSGPGVRYDSTQQVVTPTTEYETETDSEIEWEFGCPTCRTTVYKFKNAVFNEFEPCVSMTGATRGHWYRSTYPGCPCCTNQTVTLLCRKCGQKNQVQTHRLHGTVCAKCKFSFGI